VGRDVTERSCREEELRHANAALVRANSDLQQFAYSASHDLQEPLRMVATYSELLRRRFAGQLGETGDIYLSYMIEGALRMDALLRDLRTFTQVSTNTAEAVGEIESQDVLDNVRANLTLALQESGASITHTALPRVRMHAFQLEQVFQNLLSNAIRYRSGDPLQIHIAAVRQGREWLFSVQDNGIGIAPQFKELVFGLFKRLHTNAEFPGTGMGLAICQRIIDRAGGRIWVESDVGRGATFFFTIPDRQPAT
jgi:light-regulated signal transduction histidine kinase (bacteriophytochrome)